MYYESIQSQTVQIFENLEVIIESISEEKFKSIIGGFPIWKNLYHCIHSLDKNLIDPALYCEPSFHEKNMDVIYLETPKKLSKKELINYYTEVKLKIMNYLNSLNDEKLLEKIYLNEKNYTRLELILAQLRHVFYHVGYLHCCIKIEYGNTPEYIGLYKRVPDK
jgi:hypothetical protein